MKGFTVLILTVAGLISCTQGANILFYFSFSTYSHRITVWPLVEALAEKGHSVTFLQPDVNKNPHPKVKEIMPKGKLAAHINFLDNRLQQGKILAVPLVAYKLGDFSVQVCNNTLHDPDILSWINSSKYDLIIIDALYNDCALGLAHKWGAKTAIFGTTSVFEWWPDTYGFPAESSWNPIIQMTLEDLPLSFFGRVFTTLVHLFFRYRITEQLFPAIEPIMRKQLNLPDMPNLIDLEANTSLVLMNTHFSEEHARSLPPLIVPIGGMHCTEKTKPLPKEMADFIEGSGKDGFIYVSFGSGVSISKAPAELRNIFFNTFKKFTKLRFVWKWDASRPMDMPSNVFTADWIPQQAVLAHPKIRAFITHGGLLSMQEALFNAVPMISFPIFAEQDYNAERLHRTKRGIRLEITTLTQTEFEGAINKILTDDTYLENCKRTSLIFKDRPMNPLDTAVWWVEYILRHKDTSFLRPLAISQTWYQRRLLDVWGFIVLVILLTVVINIYILKKLFSCCFGSSRFFSTSSTTKKIKIKKK